MLNLFFILVIAYLVWKIKLSLRRRENYEPHSLPTSTPEGSPVKRDAFELTGRKSNFDDIARRRTTINVRFDSDDPLRKDKNFKEIDDGPVMIGATERGFLGKLPSNKSINEEEIKDVSLQNKIGIDIKNR